MFLAHLSERLTLAILVKIGPLSVVVVVKVVGVVLKCTHFLLLKNPIACFNNT